MPLPVTDNRSIYTPRPCQLLSVTSLTANEKLFQLQLADGSELQHQPGQFVQISIPGFTEAPISVASSPTRDGNFELAVRKAGSLTSALHQLQPGAQLGIRGPFGRPFQLDELRGKQLLLIAGGCGLAPLRSLIQYCQDRCDEFASVQIFYGARSEEDLMFRQELKDWQIGRNFNCRYTVDNKPANSCFDGETGLITQLLANLPIDSSNCCAVIVGPPAMYQPVIASLRQLGLNSAKQIMLSLERQMRCGIGKCGHCTIEHLYCCCDGPIFWLEEVENLRGAL